MSGKEANYWDACIFLALLKDEKRDDPNIMLGIKEQAKLFDEGKIDIATSTLILAEILPHHEDNPPNLLDNFLAMTERRNFHFVEPTMQVVLLANKIRDAIHHRDYPNLDIPDSIHLASAIASKCQTFYTLDGSREDRKGLGLLQVPQSIKDEHNILISKPFSTLPPELPGIN